MGSEPMGGRRWGAAWRWSAVWRRNALVWRKLAAASLVGNFGEPLLYLLALGYGLGAFVGEVQGLPYLAFLASGIACASAMNAASLEGTYSAYTRMAVQRTWDAMLAAPLGVGDVVLGELAWAATKALINAAPIVLVAWALGAAELPGGLWALPVLWLVGFVFGAVALVATALAPGYEFFLYFFTLLVTPMFLLSGVFFPLEVLPAWLQQASKVFPLVHAVELVRPLMAGRPVGPWAGHLAALAGYALAGWVLAVWLLERRLMR